MQYSLSPQRILYFALFIVFLIQRLYELKLTRTHSQNLRKRGGVEMYPSHFKYMICLHTSWFITCAYLGLATADFPRMGWMFLGAVLLALCQMVRAVTIQTLGDRWSTRIYVIPGEDLVQNGIYAWIRHPNYLVVVFEILIMPLLAGYWEVALVFSLLNALFLWVRIRAEEDALDSEGRYRDFKENVGCFFPKR